MRGWRGLQVGWKHVARDIASSGGGGGDRRQRRRLVVGRGGKARHCSGRKRRRRGRRCRIRRRRSSGSSRQGGREVRKQVVFFRGFEEKFIEDFGLDRGALCFLLSLVLLFLVYANGKTRGSFDRRRGRRHLRVDRRRRRRRLFGRVEDAVDATLVPLSESERKRNERKKRR